MGAGRDGNAGPRMGASTSSGRHPPPPGRLLPAMRFPGQVLYACTLREVDAACRGVLAWARDACGTIGGEAGGTLGAKSCGAVGDVSAVLGGESAAQVGSTALVKGEPGALAGEAQRVGGEAAARGAQPAVQAGEETRLAGGSCQPTGLMEGDIVGNQAATGTSGWVPSVAPCGARAALTHGSHRERGGGQSGESGVGQSGGGERSMGPVPQDPAMLHQVMSPRHVTVGFDIEWRVTFQSGASPAKTSVIQICPSPARCYVLHLAPALAGRSDEGDAGCPLPESLCQVLRSPHIHKAGVGVGGDAMKLRRDFGVDTVSLCDLGGMARARVMPQGAAGAANGGGGLSALVENVLGARLDKLPRLRLSNWDEAPLSRAQLQYAATDAFASLMLFQALERLPLLPPPAPYPRPPLAGIREAPSDALLAASGLGDASSVQESAGRGTQGAAPTTVLFVGLSAPLPPAVGLLNVRIPPGKWEGPVTLKEVDREASGPRVCQHNGADGEAKRKNDGLGGNEQADTSRGVFCDWDSAGQLTPAYAPNLDGHMTTPGGHIGAGGPVVEARSALVHDLPTVKYSVADTSRPGAASLSERAGSERASVNGATVGVAGGVLTDDLLALTNGGLRFGEGDAVASARRLACDQGKAQGACGVLAVAREAAGHLRGHLPSLQNNYNVNSDNVNDSPSPTFCDSTVEMDDKENRCPLCRGTPEGSPTSLTANTSKPSTPAVGPTANIAESGVPAAVPTAMASEACTPASGPAGNSPRGPVEAPRGQPVQGPTRLQPAKMAVYELHWSQGLCVHHISQRRCLKVDTVMGYLAEALAGGWPYAWHRLGVDDRQLACAVRAIVALASAGRDAASGGKQGVVDSGDGSAMDATPGDGFCVMSWRRAVNGGSLGRGPPPGFAGQPVANGVMPMGVVTSAPDVEAGGVWVNLEGVSIKELLEAIPDGHTGALSYGQMRLVITHLRRLAATYSTAPPAVVNHAGDEVQAGIAGTRHQCF
eukprot:jgi/Mesvir1/27984/Mv20184-RA.2